MRSALVTGGGKGIGRAVCKALAEDNVNILINYQSSENEALKALDEVKSLGAEAFIFKADVSDSAQVKAMFEYAASCFGGIDILVNNAGITRDGLAVRMSDEDFDRVLAVNLKGAFNCCRESYRYMAKSDFGRIINISSVVGIAGNAGQANYAAAKAGLIGLTKSLAKEFARKNITVNAVAPGFIDTDMTSKLTDDIKAQLLSGIPLKRFGRPEDVANAVAFLASERAGYITGQVIQVTGGMA